MLNRAVRRLCGLFSFFFVLSRIALIGEFSSVTGATMSTKEMICLQCLFFGHLDFAPVN